MKLSEKIVYCRKRAGLSQDALAERIGTSRQAVSKWETGDAIPETTKLPQLAKIFHVSIDWLLSEDEPEPATPQRAQTPPETTTWVDAVPGVLGKLLRHYGWLFGVYLAVGGLGFTIVGTLARVMTRQMFSFDTYGMYGDMSGFGSNNPVATMGTVIMVIGLVMMLAGVILAVCLKKRDKGE